MASPNLFLLPLHPLATAPFISTSACRMGSWEKAADLYFSSLVGSGLKRCANEAEVKGRSHVGRFAGPLGLHVHFRWLRRDKARA